MGSARAVWFKQTEDDQRFRRRILLLHIRDCVETIRLSISSRLNNTPPA